MKTCPTCRLEYGRSYEEHTGKPAHKEAVRVAVRGSDRPLTCCGSRTGHLPTCEVLR